MTMTNRSPIDRDYFDGFPEYHIESPGPEAGVYEDLEESSYHELPALGSSLMRLGLAESLKQYRHQKQNPPGHSDGMTLGSLVHWSLLEPERWRREVIERPEPPVDPETLSSTDVAIVKALAADEPIDCEAVADQAGVKTSTVETRAADRDDIRQLADYLAELDFDEIPDDETIAKAESIRRCILEHPRIRGGMLDYETGRSELSLVWDDPFRPVRCKGRIDFETPVYGGVYLLDIKTTHMPVGAWRSERLYKPGHWAALQAGHYAQGYETLTDRNVHAFAFVVCQTEPPHDCRIISVEGDALEQARDWQHGLLGELVHYWRNPKQYLGAYPDVDRVQERHEYRQPQPLHHRSTS